MTTSTLSVGSTERSRPTADPRLVPPRARFWDRVGAVVAVVTLLVTLPAAVGASAGEYEVRPGDSLSVIARDHGVATADLASVNGISDLHLIRVGQVLTIPGQVHVVASGESLSVIARRYGLTTAELAAVNGIENVNRIRIGQELRIPGAAPVDPAAGYDSLPGKLRANPERLELIPSFERWAAHYDLPTDLLMAVAYRESGWQNQVVSSKGAVGVGQLMPATSAWVAESLIGADLDPQDPDDNIRMSARFLAWLIGYMGDVDRAVAAYYQGPGSVRTRGYYDDTKAYLVNINQIRPMFRRST